MNKPGLPTGFFTPDVLWVAFFTIFWYFVSYIINPSMPGNNEQYFIGWFGWFDQGSYLKCAEDLSHFSLTPENYNYPLGYPLLGALFIRFLPRHAFLIPNLICTIGIILLFYSICKMKLTKIESVLLCVFSFILSGFVNHPVLYGGLIWENCLILPWNLIPPFFTFYLCIYFIIFKKANLKTMAFCSLFIGYAFFCRPPSALFLLLIYFAGLIDLKSLKERIYAIVIFGIPCIFFLAVVLITKLYTFGSILSPYDYTIQEIGFNSSRILYKLYLVFLDGMPIYNYPFPMIIAAMPWCLLSVPGIVVLSKIDGKKVYFLIASIVVCYLFYTSFNCMAPTLVYTYHAYRYFAWTFPWFGLFGYLTLTRSISFLGWKKVALYTVPVLFITAFLGWKEVPLTNYQTGQTTKPMAGLKVNNSYNASDRNFTITLELPAKSNLEGVRFYPVGFSYGFSDSRNWQKVEIEADGQQVKLYRDFLMSQNNENAVTIVFRNKIAFKKLKISFSETEEPYISRLILLQKRFQPFILVKRLMIKANIAPIEWRLTSDNSYNYETMVLFGIGGNSDCYKLAGWSGNEVGYNWSDGNSAVLAFIVPRSEKPIYLKMTLAGFATSELPYQPVTVFANDKKIAEWEVSVKEEFQAVIPPSVAKKNGVLIIKLDIPKATSPAYLGYNTDARILGVASYNVVLSEF